MGLENFKFFGRERVKLSTNINEKKELATLFPIGFDAGTQWWWSLFDMVCVKARTLMDNTLAVNKPFSNLSFVFLNCLLWLLVITPFHYEASFCVVIFLGCRSFFGKIPTSLAVQQTFPVLFKTSTFLNCNIFLTDAPGQPNITGLRKTTLDEGQMKRISCISMAGNPLPDLKWFRGGEEIQGIATEKDEQSDFSRSDLIIAANRSDNGLEYRCEASNPATETPLVAQVTLHVRFKPDNIKMRVDPDTPKAGKKAVLTCESGSSNPTASIVWRKADQVLEGGKVIEIKAGEFGGNMTTNQLEVNVTAGLHGAVYICEAVNHQLQESVHNAITLSVKCKLFVTRRQLWH